MFTTPKYISGRWTPHVPERTNGLWGDHCLPQAMQLLFDLFSFGSAVEDGGRLFGIRKQVRLL